MIALGLGEDGLDDGTGAGGDPKTNRTSQVPLRLEVAQYRDGDARDSDIRLAHPHRCDPTMWKDAHLDGFKDRPRDAARVSIRSLRCWSLRGVEARGVTSSA